MAAFYNKKMARRGRSRDTRKVMSLAKSSANEKIIATPCPMLWPSFVSFSSFLLITSISYNRIKLKAIEPGSLNVTISIQSTMGEHAGDKRRRRGRQSDDKSKHNKADASKAKDIGKATQQQHTTLLLQLTDDAPKWYLIGKQLPERNDTSKKSDDKTKNDTPNTPAIITKYRQQADDLFRQEIALALSNKSKDDAWMESTMRKGTLKDRIAAMSVVLSQSPIHQFHVLQQLMDMTRPTNNSRVAQLAAEALLDLWIHTYLPSQRPLMALSQRPLMRYHAQQTLSPRILLLWRFEEMIMEQYLAFLQQYLKYTLQEGLETQKIFALKSAATLLQRIPTGEQILLSLLVNKLGDPARKIAARAAHELRGILFHHPAMQPVVAREVQQTVHRPHLSPKALYHCILFLNQLEFSSRNPQSVALATSLIQTYFQLFEWAISGRTATKDAKSTKAPEDTKLNSRLLSALLTGVNRAHPYVDASHDMEQYMDALYRVVHTAPPAACTQAMLLLFHLVIGVEQKQQQQEQKQRRNKKDRQVPVVATPLPTTPEHEARRTRFYRALYAKLIDTQLLYSGKHLTQFFNLLYKSFKYDTNERRIQACCKRLVSTIMSCPNSATVTATLYLWHEVARIHPFLQQSYAQVVQEDSEFILDVSKRDPRSALVQMENGLVSTAVTDSHEVGHVNAPVWEMNLLQHHYHPSVVKFTHSLDSELGYNGDPLRDFAFGYFLDKFAYRNPKTSQRSTEQARSAVMERHRSSTPMVPVNDRSFLQKNEVSPEDEFFFRFFEERAKRDEVKGIVRYKDTKKGRKEDDDDSQELLDKVEQNNVDDHYDDDFDAYERAWEDDPEEEAFVDSLAESLMEDTMDMPSDLDDEDPDMEGWDDLHDDDDNQLVVKDSDDDDEDDVDDNAKGSENDSSSSPDDHDNVDDDDDAFMDQSDDSDSDAEMPPKLVLEDDEDDEEKEDKSEDEESVDQDDEGDDEEEEEDDDAELLFMAGGMDDDEDEEDDLEEAVGFRGKKKSKIESSVFASAEEYEERIDESFRELRSSMPPIIQHCEEDESIEETATEAQPKSKQNKRKKNKKKR